jgi:tetratricopeptide (TPR) repeat protein
VARSRYSQADTEFSKAIEIDPDYAQAYKARGYLWSLQKDEDKVIRDYDEAIRIVPTDAYSYLNRGLAWLRKEELDKALADLDRSLQLQPESALALKFRGYLRSTRGERDRAIEDFDRSVALDARDGETFLMRGQAQQALRKYAEALADFSRAIKLDPNNPRTHNSRAWLQATCPDATIRNGKNAVVDGRRACLLTEEKDAYCCGTLGAAYAEAGDFQSAIEWQTKGMKLKADDEKYLEAARKRLELYKAGQPYHLESQT